MTQLPRVTGRSCGTLSLSDGTLCRGHGLNALFKAARKVAGARVAGHPTKRWTKHRRRFYDPTHRTRRIRARVRYEDLLCTLYDRAGCALTKVEP